MVRMCRGRETPLEFTVDVLSCMFGGTQAAAAVHFGMSLSSMQRVCRELGMRWPKKRASSGRCVIQPKLAIQPKVAKRQGRRLSRPVEEVVRVFPRGSGIAVDVSVHTLSCMFGGTQDAAARRLGVSLWMMKTLCRRLGLCWPKSYSRKKQEVEQGDEGRLPAWHEFGEEPQEPQTAEDCSDYTGELCLVSGAD